MPLPNPLYVLLDGNKFITVIGAVVAAPSPVDVIVSYGATYRNNVNAQLFGRSPVSGFQIATGSGTALPINGDVIVTDTVTPLPIVDGILAAINLGDDQVNAVEPHPLMITVSMKQWLDGVGGTVVGECKWSEYIGISAQIPQVIGNTPPQPLDATP